MSSTICFFFNFYYIYLNQIFIFSLYSFILVSTHFPLCSFLISSYISHLICPLYERHYLVNSFPFFINSSGSTTPFIYHRYRIFPLFLNTLRQRKNATSNLCTYLFKMYDFNNYKNILLMSSYFIFPSYYFLIRPYLKIWVYVYYFELSLEFYNTQ